MRALGPSLHTALLALVIASCGELSGLSQLQVCDGGSDAGCPPDHAAARDGSQDDAGPGPDSPTCAPVAAGCWGSTACCAPLVCNAGGTCATTCTSQGKQCGETTDCCARLYCPPAGGTCTACIGNAQSCSEDLQCCSHHCVASRCAED